MALTPTTTYQFTVNTLVPVELFSTATNARLQAINICNLDTADVTVTIYYDIDGSVFDDDSTLAKEFTVNAGNWYVYDVPLLMDFNGALGIKVSTVDVVCVTVFVWEDI